MLLSFDIEILSLHLFRKLLEFPMILLFGVTANLAFFKLKFQSR
jgi:hypothetical protein